MTRNNLPVGAGFQKIVDELDSLIQEIESARRTTGRSTEKPELAGLARAEKRARRLRKQLVASIADPGKRSVEKLQAITAAINFLAAMVRAICSLINYLFTQIAGAHEYWVNNKAIATCRRSDPGLSCRKTWHFARISKPSRTWPSSAWSEHVEVGLEGIQDPSSSVVCL